MTLSLDDIRNTAAVCEECSLHEGRIKPVFDKGNPESGLFICGMVPADEENEQGLPFVGRSGRLLDALLEDAGLSLENVYITNLVKCYLAAGKKLDVIWVDSCIQYLMAQLELLRPKVIITLGKDASSAILPGTKNKAMGTLRSKVFTFSDYSVVPTYHPSFLLRCGGQSDKRGFYEKTLNDFKKAIDIL